MLDELGLRELGKRVRDEEPRALAVDEDVLVRTKYRVAVEEARRNFEPGSTVRGTGGRRPAARTEGHPVGWGALADGCRVFADQLSAIALPHKDICLESHPSLCHRRGFSLLQIGDLVGFVLERRCLEPEPRSLGYQGQEGERGGEHEHAED